MDEEAEFWDTHDLSEVSKNPKVSISKLAKLKNRDSDNTKFAF